MANATVTGVLRPLSAVRYAERASISQQIKHAGTLLALSKFDNVSQSEKDEDTGMSIGLSSIQWTQPKDYCVSPITPNQAAGANLLADRRNRPRDTADRRTLVRSAD